MKRNNKRIWFVVLAIDAILLIWIIGYFFLGRENNPQEYIPPENNTENTADNENTTPVIDENTER